MKTSENGPGVFQNHGTCTTLVWVFQPQPLAISLVSSGRNSALAFRGVCRIFPASSLLPSQRDTFWLSLTMQKWPRPPGSIPETSSGAPQEQ